MFNFRQSSLPIVAPARLNEGQFGGAAIAFSIAGAHGAAGCGGFQRRSPTGGAANGMPRKAHDAPLSTPCTSPLVVVTRQDAASGLPAGENETSAPGAAAIKIAAMTTRVFMRGVLGTLRLEVLGKFLEFSGFSGDQ